MAKHKRRIAPAVGHMGSITSHLHTLSVNLENPVGLRLTVSRVVRRERSTGAQNEVAEQIRTETNANYTHMPYGPWRVTSSVWVS